MGSCSASTARRFSPGMGLEGIVSKKLIAPYLSGRRSCWFIGPPVRARRFLAGAHPSKLDGGGASSRDREPLMFSPPLQPAYATGIHLTVLFIVGGATLCILAIMGG